MSYLLDTTVISEMMRPDPNSGLADFLGAAPDGALFTSVPVVGEVIFGLARLPDGTRKRTLVRRFQDLRESKFPAVLPADERAAALWATHTAEAMGRGVIVPAFDGLIAATAQARGPLIVTRNARDFVAAGANVLDPWT